MLSSKMRDNPEQIQQVCPPPPLPARDHHVVEAHSRTCEVLQLRWLNRFSAQSCPSPQDLYVYFKFQEFQQLPVSSRC